MSVVFFAQKIERSDLPVFSIKQNLAKKTGSYAKSKSFEGNNVSYSFYPYIRVQMSTPFFRDRP